MAEGMWAGPAWSPGMILIGHLDGVELPACEGPEQGWGGGAASLSASPSSDSGTMSLPSTVRLMHCAKLKAQSEICTKTAAGWKIIF